MFALARLTGRVRRILPATVAVAAALTFACHDAKAQWMTSQSSSFGASFNNSWSKGYGPGGAYNTGSSSSNWYANVNGSKTFNSPYGNFNSGYNLNVGGYKSNSWGNGYGPSGNWGYQNGSQGGYLQGNRWRNRW